MTPSARHILPADVRAVGPQEEYAWWHSRLLAMGCNYTYRHIGGGRYEYYYVRGEMASPPVLGDLGLGMHIEGARAAFDLFARHNQNQK